MLEAARVISPIHSLDFSGNTRPKILHRRIRKITCFGNPQWRSTFTSGCSASSSSVSPRVNVVAVFHHYYSAIQWINARLSKPRLLRNMMATQIAAHSPTIEVVAVSQHIALSQSVRGEDGIIVIPSLLRVGNRDTDVMDQNRARADGVALKPFDVQIIHPLLTLPEAHREDGRMTTVPQLDEITGLVQTRVTNLAGRRS